EGEGEAAPEPVRLDVNVDAYVPADYVPYEQAKIEIHRRVAGALELAELERLRDDLEDRFGPVPEPVANMLALQRARIEFGEPAPSASEAPGWRSCRSSSTLRAHADCTSSCPSRCTSRGARR